MRGLYTGIAVVGAIGSGKTQAVILPAMRQLFAYRANDIERKLSGLVLEVKGDLCRQLKGILGACGRSQDYVEVSLSGDLRYNPLNNSLDAYAQAFNIASIITAIWGKGKEPFWQQSYTDLVRYVIILHRVRDGYVTLVDVFRTLISAGQLEALLVEVGSRFNTASYIGVDKDSFDERAAALASFSFTPSKSGDEYIAPWSDALERLLSEEMKIEASVYTRKPFDPAQASPVGERLLLVLGTLEVLSRRSQNLDRPGHRSLPLVVRDRRAGAPGILPSKGTLRG